MRNDIIAYYRDGVMPEVEYPNDLPFEDDVSFSIDNTGNDDVKLQSQIINEFDAVVEDIMTIDDEIAKKFAENRVAVEVSENTPAVILDNVEGARNLQIIINYSKLYLAVRDSGIFKGHYHNLGVDIAKKLPQFLNEPDVIVQLNNGRLNVLTTIETKRGNNGIISVELNSTKDIDGKYKDYNVIVTMFSSDNDYVKNLLSNDGVKVKYKREDLSQVNPQLYKWLAIINDKSSVDNNIPQNDMVVNNSISENSKNDTNRGEINERAGDILLSEDNRRGNNESAGKQAYGIRQNGEGKSQSERFEHTSRLREKGLISQHTFKNKYVVDVISEDGYNAEMTELADQLKAYGFENVYFITGKGRFKFLPWRTFEGAVANKGRDIYIQYDAETSPAMLANHELAHIYYNNDVKKSVLAGLSVKELNEILKRDRYREYNRIYRSYDKVLEEVVCDILSGISEHSARFDTARNEFWSGIDAVSLDNYKPAEYNKTIDAGGSAYDGQEMYALSKRVKWRTDLNKTQFKEVEKWLRQAGKPQETRITDTANWYKGRINGKDLFVIYSTEDSNNPTILYEVKGKQAKVENDILRDVLEAKENGKSDIGRTRRINWLLGGNWMQRQHNLANNDDRPRGRGSNTGYASILQGKSSEFIGSKAFRNVVRNLFEIQDGVKYSLNDDTRFTLSDNPDTSYLAEPVRELKDDIKEVMLRADAREGKVYTRADVRQVTNSILENIDPGTGRGLSMSKKLQSKMQNLVGWVLNTPKIYK